jgi:hypothetical protein
MNDESTQDITGTHIKGLYAVARAEVEAMGETRKRLEALGSTVGGNAGAEARQAVEAALVNVPKAVASIEGAASQARYTLRYINLWVAALALLVGLATGCGGSAAFAYYVIFPELDTLSAGQHEIQTALKNIQAAPTHAVKPKTKLRSVSPD